MLDILFASDRFTAALVLGLLGLAIVAAALRDAGGNEPDSQTVLTICRGGPKRDREQLRELLDAFHRTHPDIRVRVIATDVDRKTDTMIAAGMPPDLIYVLCDRLDYYADSGALLDLSPFIANDAPLSAALHGTAAAPPDFFPQLLKSLERDGRLFALPINYMPFVVYYSRDLFDKWRVPYPDSEWNWNGLRERAIALTRDDQGRTPDHPQFDPAKVVTHGLRFETWQHGPECFIRQNGGALVSADGNGITADDPRAVQALQFLYDLKHLDRACPPGMPARGLGSDFGRGAVAMHISGSFRIASLREQAPRLSWDIAPLPRGPDGRRASIVFANAWGISSKSRHPRAAFKLLRFMLGEEGMRITARHAVFLPTRKSVAEQLIAANPDQMPRSRSVLLHDVQNGYASPPFATRRYYTDVYELINEHFEQLLAAPRPPYDPLTCCQIITREGNRILRRDRNVPRPTSFGMAVLAFAAAPVFAVAWLLRRRAARPPARLNQASPYARRPRRLSGMWLVMPWIIGFLVLAAGPIAVSLALSLSQWQSLSDVTRSEFVGLGNYRVALSGEDPKFWPALAVTARYALITVPVGLVGGLALALLLNRSLRGIGVFRTLYYVPVVLPTVAVAALWWHLFDGKHGWINHALRGLNVGGWIERVFARIGIDYPPQWLNSASLAPWVFVLAGLWTLGGGMLIYLAGLQSIPTELYEAAALDGAGHWSRLRHVTLPMLSPVIFFNLVIGLIGSFQVFNIAFVLYDGQPGPGDSALFYGLHLFREAFFRYRLGYASALAWILFAITLALTLLVFKSTPLWLHAKPGGRTR